MSIPPEQLLSEFDDLLRSMPPRGTFHQESPEIDDWLGRALALVSMWDRLKIPFFENHVSKLHDRFGFNAEDAMKGVLRTLNQARHELRLNTIGPLTLAINKGGVFDYFDELRKIIEAAKTDLLFIDPYLDAEFVSRYLPHVGHEVQVRLLAWKMLPTLIPAVALIRQQEQLSIEVRSAIGFHDRYIFVDHQLCFHSGASFKDGAKKAPTAITQIVDAFQTMSNTYEDLWNSATAAG